MTRQSQSAAVQGGWRPRPAEGGVHGLNSQTPVPDAEAGPAWPSRVSHLPELLVVGLALVFPGYKTSRAKENSQMSTKKTGLVGTVVQTVSRLSESSKVARRDPQVPMPELSSKILGP